MIDISITTTILYYVKNTLNKNHGQMYFIPLYYLVHTHTTLLTPQHVMKSILSVLLERLYCRLGLPVSLRHYTPRLPSPKKIHIFGFLSLFKLHEVFLYTSHIHLVPSPTFYFSNSTSPFRQVYVNIWYSQT